MNNFRGGDSLLLLEKLAPITQYQDLGRFGHLQNGFSHSGPMDDGAFRLNNALLNNDANATQIEIGLGGLQVRALSDCTIAICGADFNTTVNNTKITNFSAHHLCKDDVLAFHYASNSNVGQYAYLAVAGGFFVKPFLGSTSSTARLQLFPNTFNAGALTVDSILSGHSRLCPPRKALNAQDIPRYTEDTIKVIAGYQYQQFAAEARRSFSQQTFTIKGGDRMGTKLSAQQAITYEGGELLSEGIVTGAIQIPPDGNPIVLQKDAQSIGGYPKIGVVPEPYRSQLAQMPTGRTVRFYFDD